MKSENGTIYPVNEYNRRDFLKQSAICGFGAALSGMNLHGCAAVGRRMRHAPAELFSAPPIDSVRIGYVGVGGMGTNHVKNLLKIEGVQI